MKVGLREVRHASLQDMLTRSGALMASTHSGQKYEGALLSSNEVACHPEGTSNTRAHPSSTVG